MDSQSLVLLLLLLLALLIVPGVLELRQQQQRNSKRPWLANFKARRGSRWAALEMRADHDGGAGRYAL